MIPYGRQNISQADVDAVIDVLRSDFLTQGPVVPEFERTLAARCGASHAVAVNSATSALHIACRALDLKTGDVLWTVPNTFVASANCGLYCGADVDFVDIDPETWNLSVTALRAKLIQAKKENKLPKIVVPVHFAGQPTDQEEIWNLSQEFGFKILEDASHAVGASRNGEPVGSGRWSHVTIFSFHPVKIITTSEGGMALTNDAELAWRMANLRSHGITRERARMVQPTQDAWYYEQIDLGYNYRMTDIQAALGLSQCRRLGEFVERRNALARRYDDLLTHLPLQRPTLRPGNQSAYHLYVVRLSGASPARHREVLESLHTAGIGVNLHYRPVYLQPYYRRLGFKPGLCPEAEKYAEEAMTLPLHPALTSQEQDAVAAALNRILK